MRHNPAEDDEPTGRLPVGTEGWTAAPAPLDDLEPGLWDSGGPGSASAADRGCLCPMLPNDPRAGLGLLIAPDCPLHRQLLD
ncbi:hypothetical protein [Pseudonocardia sp. MH-G8]|uniref:hypothetical protein n=1 Tax=Pseudonocardia sp. MH-G8 TaxID=1854588 RepID=UPI00117BBDC9|nr:hypothetical protein [Pseudonocardia sp. MH-G8]